MTQRLLVVGAGPKGLAIAAKRAVLREHGYDVPEVVLLDRRGVAAQWSGAHGFTDGRRILGTLPEKDVGYPYDSTCWGDAGANRRIDRAMTAYSWPQHLIEEYAYAEWIDRGRPRPTHRQWSAYLRWVARKVGVDVRAAEVTGIELTADGRRWRLAVRARQDGASQTVEGDGLVITGPGLPIAVPGQPEDDPRVLDGSNVWQALDRLAGAAPSHGKHIHVGIVGTGETAAAAVVALLEVLGNRAEIEVLSPRGVLYSRDEGFEENQLFSNPDPHSSAALGKHHHYDSEADDGLTHTHAVRWLSLTEEDRREFVRRADRGVFSVAAMRDMTQAWNVRSVNGNATRIAADAAGITVEAVYGGATTEYRYDYVVVARGFDPTWFVALLNDEARERLASAVGSNALSSAAFERAIATDLSVADTAPRLHLPMLAGVAQGPGFPNLSCLGLLSDRVLASYVGLPAASNMLQ